MKNGEIAGNKKMMCVLAGTGWESKITWVG